MCYTALHLIDAKFWVATKWDFQMKNPGEEHCHWHLWTDVFWRSYSPKIISGILQTQVRQKIVKAKQELFVAPVIINQWLYCCIGHHRHPQNNLAMLICFFVTECIISKLIHQSQSYKSWNKRFFLFNACGCFLPATIPRINQSCRQILPWFSR